VGLVLFTTKTDKGGQAIEEEAVKMSLSCQTYFCEELVCKNGKIFNANLNPLSIDQNDKIILRDPYSAKGNYGFFTRKILEKYYENILLDRERYSKFPFCQDKLFQADFFIKLGITTPETFWGRSIIGLLEFPVIAKPRIGSRGRGVRRFKDPEKLVSFFMEKDPLNYLVQKYHKAENEYRILLLKHKILGVAGKRIYLKKRGGVGVKVNRTVNNLPEEIKKDAIRITEATKADFVGVDVIQAGDGEYYFLEANLSPQFSAFVKVTGVNVAREIIFLALS